VTRDETRPGRLFCRSIGLSLHDDPSRPIERPSRGKEKPRESLSNFCTIDAESAGLDPEKAGGRGCRQEGRRGSRQGHIVSVPMISVPQASSPQKQEFMATLRPAIMLVTSGEISVSLETRIMTANKTRNCRIKALSLNRVVKVKQPEIEHGVPIRDYEYWLDSAGKTPR
jgi:hypothetical protein